MAIEHLHDPKTPLTAASSFEDFLSYTQLPEHIAEAPENRRWVGLFALNTYHALIKSERLARQHAANEQLQLRLDEQSLDKKTGCLTADAFEEAVRVRFDGSNKPSYHDVLVVALDLKGMKGANDTFGHDAGDQLLKATGTALHSLTRAGDIVARAGRGADEFSVVMELPIGVKNDEAEAIINERFEKVFGKGYSPPTLRAALNSEQDMLVAARYQIRLCQAPVSSNDIFESLKVADLEMTETANLEATRGLPPRIVDKDIAKS